MKKSELRQMIREEYQRLLNEKVIPDFNNPDWRRMVSAPLGKALDDISEWEIILRKSNYDEANPDHYKAAMEAIAKFRSSLERTEWKAVVDKHRRPK